MKVIECAQKSPEWYAVRCGIPTASSFDKIVTSEGKPSKQRMKYLWQLAAERLSAVSEESFQSAAMLRGIECEDEAIRFYEFATGLTVSSVGFCLSDCGRYGASPDGLVGEDGLIEIKCPSAATHVGYILDNRLPPDYVQQTQGQLLVTKRKWCDFLSYYPGLKPLLLRITPDTAFISALTIELNSFCAELDKITARIA